MWGCQRRSTGSAGLIALVQCGIWSRELRIWFITGLGGFMDLAWIAGKGELRCALTKCRLIYQKDFFKHDKGETPAWRNIIKK